ncbi:prostaglandin E receptor 1c (subtype EP1) [Lepisosteus oculatus]|uniref:prostaglandin E receptor 1c (subtype EP1) n=1 Tax=Lepisosteus oculatus TaxID=7918 RepID=UPI0035F50130
MAHRTAELTPVSILYPRPNSTTFSPLPALNASQPKANLSIAMPCFTMSLGAISNLIALGILVKSYARFRRRSRTTFLLLVGALLATDLVGHIIPGAFALRLYLAKMHWSAVDRSGAFCQLFGACMVFFGLCPLFLSGAMAVERCVGVTRPLLHSRAVTSTHAKLAVALLYILALLVAALPLAKVGRYSRQFPDTWCFLQVHGTLSLADLGLTLVFSGLGLASLCLSLLCNSLSGLALLQARLGGSQKLPGARQHSTQSHDIEMMAQLAGITLVSCICWSPFLIFISLSVSKSFSGTDYDLRHYQWLVFLGVRMASWNQILDPWVYILLRRAVLRRVYRVLNPHRQLAHSSFRTMEKDQQNASLH